MAISLLMVISPSCATEVSMWALICATVVYAAEWDPQKKPDVGVKNCQNDLVFIKQNITY